MTVASAEINLQRKHDFIYNKVYYRLSHDVVTWDVDRDVSTAYC